jgi:hypothetical protein
MPIPLAQLIERLTVVKAHALNDAETVKNAFCVGEEHAAAQAELADTEAVLDEAIRRLTELNDRES